MEKTRGSLAGNTSTGSLKLLALVFMCCDHMGKMLFPGTLEMRMIGRLAFPLYCWCLVVGFQYTRSVPKYMLRLLAVGLISQPLYMAALDHTWTQPNIFLTLLLGLAALWAMREKWCLSHLWGPALALGLAVLLGCDYGWRGVLLIMLLWAAREKRSAIAAVMIAFCLFWGSNSAAFGSVCGLPLAPLLSLPAVGPLLSPWMRLQALAILALPFMLLPLPQVKLPVWAGYALYPLHLVLLIILEHL